MIEADTDTFQDTRPLSATEVAPTGPFLFVVLESDRPTSGGARFALADVDAIVIGRARERCASRQVKEGVRILTVGVPGRSMSSIHARIVRSTRGWVLEDARSTNGSIINGARVDNALLHDRDVIDLGHTIFMLRHSLPMPPGGCPDFDCLQAAPKETGILTLLPALDAELSGLARAANSNLPALLLGATGTGKEVLARAVHKLSNRRGPLVAVNCGAIPSNLIESQLFGHVKGAFSGATADALGFFRSAEGGTLLIDEIGDLPLAAQPALLRVLQEREVVPVGSARPIRIDVRVIAATHRMLGDLVSKDHFRRDLLARIDAFRFKLPDLRDRIEDVGCLVAAIITREIGRDIRLAPEVGAALAMHPWPANIRELAAVLHRAAVLAGDGLLELRHLRLSEMSPGTSPSHGAASYFNRQGELDGLLRDELVARLSEAEGNIAEVARAMGKARMQIQRWMKRFGIQPSMYRVAESKDTSERAE